LPMRRRYYQDLYRDVADAAGVPRAVWNMFARHGGVTEAHESGADLVDVSKHGVSLAKGSLIARTRTEHETRISNRGAKSLVQLGGLEPPAS
jgi:hypothetical protein